MPVSQGQNTKRKEIAKVLGVLFKLFKQCNNDTSKFWICRIVQRHIFKILATPNVVSGPTESMPRSS